MSRRGGHVVCHPSSRETEAGGLGIQGPPLGSVARPYVNDTKKGCLFHLRLQQDHLCLILTRSF
jgi:hypothetical protein